MKTGKFEVLNPKEFSKQQASDMFIYVLMLDLAAETATNSQVGLKSLAANKADILALFEGCSDPMQNNEAETVALLKESARLVLAINRSVVMSKSPRVAAEITRLRQLLNQTL